MADSVDNTNPAARARTGAAWSRTEFEAKLRERGRAYHIHHPFN